jgi:hypothetical protein
MTEGTRFKLYPQAPFAGDEPLETVWISSPAGTVGPGPRDDRLYTVYPIGKTHPYGIVVTPSADPESLPPWLGPVLPPPYPSAEGHFDHVETETPQFEAAHAFGCARFVIDIWEDYFGRALRWQFSDRYPRMEISLYPPLDNAYSGYGFIELGAEGSTGDHYSLNFDVIAHELGHAIIYGEVGVPDPGAEIGEYYGFHESAADLVALISSLHFETLVDHLLLQTRGNLYTYNALSRVSELAPNRQIRIAANDVRLSAFKNGWRNEHTLSLPLTGAFFDILVDIFHEILKDNRLISQTVEDLSDKLLARPEYGRVMQAEFDRLFPRNPEGFKAALLAARDTMGAYLAATWLMLDRDYLDYTDVADAFEAVDQTASAGRYRRLIRGNFAMRDIGYVRVGPQLAPLKENSHFGRHRTLLPPR